MLTMNLTNPCSLQFSDGVNNSRSSAANRIRKQVGPELFGVTQADMSSGHARFQALDPKLMGMERDGDSRVKFPANYSCFNVPILHRDTIDTFCIDAIFRNSGLIQVFLHLSLTFCFHLND